MKNRKTKNIPTNAFLNENNLWETCRVDSKGHRHGKSTCWTKAGILLFEIEYKDNLYDGSSKFYLPNGALKEESLFIKGKYQQGTFYVNKKYNANVRPDCSTDVIQWKMLTKKPNYISKFIFYDKNENEIDRKGKPIPKLPKNVPKDVDYYPQDRNPWVQFTIKFPEYTRIGVWKRWDTNGELALKEYYSDLGKLICIEEYSFGKLISEKHYDVASETVKSTLKYINNKPFFRTEYNYDGSQLVARQDFIFENGKKMKSGEGQVAPKSRTMLYSVYSRSNGDKLAFGSIQDETLKGTWKVMDSKSSKWLSVDIGKNYLTITDNNLIEHLTWIHYDNLFELALKKKIKLPEHLKNVNSIKWVKVDSAFRKYTAHFPKIIAMIASNEPYEMVAREKIFKECNHQDTLYEATAQIVPIYLELVKDKKVNRKGILEDLKLFAVFTKSEIDQILKDKSIKKNSSLWYSTVGVLKAFSDGLPILKEIALDKKNGLSLLATDLLKFIKKIDKTRLNNTASQR
ncbi:MAG: hypothetical protein HUU56_04675 [Bdellovibrionaceae bacterium]|nr:hypothetical protein [Pseudobdellovibrionaceae bacterium]